MKIMILYACLVEDLYSSCINYWYMYSSKYLNAIFQTYNANTLPPPLINPDAWGQMYPE